MRSFALISILFVSACSDYELNKLDDANEVGYTASTPTTTDPAEVVEEDPAEDDVVEDDEPVTDETDLDDDGCWFGVKEYFSSDHETGVKTLPVISLIGPNSIVVARGEDVVFEFSVSSYHECGDIDVNEFFFGVYDFTDGSDEWLKPLNDDSVPSNFENMNNGDLFPSYAARNMYVTQTGNQLFYVWHDETNNGEGYGEVIDTQRVTASGEHVYRFTWTGSEYAPIGRTFQIGFTDITWTDVTTGATIWYDWAEDYSTTGLYIDVTVN